jgi:8-oxo-dGTP diphosphatase
MPEPKVEQWEGRDIHVSVGALIVQDDQILLMERTNPPYGLAGPAGHVDEGETAETAVSREVTEETGLTIITKKLLVEEFIPWNTCSRGVEGHYWYLYGCIVDGKLQRSAEEAKSLGWYAIAELTMDKLEPVWKYWLEKPEVRREIV